jgi:hypothetical protein
MVDLSPLNCKDVLYFLCLMPGPFINGETHNKATSSPRPPPGHPEPIRCRSTILCVYSISPVPPGWQSHHHSLVRVHVVPAWQLVPLQALSAHSRPAAPQPGRPFTTVVLRPPHCWRVTRMVEPVQQWKQHTYSDEHSNGPQVKGKGNFILYWHSIKSRM